MKRGMITLGLGSVITIVLAVSGGVWAIGKSLTTNAVDIARAQSEITSHESEDKADKMRVDQEIKSLEDKLDVVGANAAYAVTLLGGRPKISHDQEVTTAPVVKIQ